MDIATEFQAWMQENYTADQVRMMHLGGVLHFESPLAPTPDEMARAVLALGMTVQFYQSKGVDVPCHEVTLFMQKLIK